jgi:hypothetical protein
MPVLAWRFLAVVWVRHDAMSKEMCFAEAGEWGNVFRSSCGVGESGEWWIVSLFSCPTVAVRLVALVRDHLLHPVRFSDTTKSDCLLSVGFCWRLIIVSKFVCDSQAYKSPVVVKGPFFPRVVNPRYRIRGTNVWRKT